MPARVPTPAGPMATRRATAPSRRRRYASGAGPGSADSRPAAALAPPGADPGGGRGRGRAGRGRRGLGRGRLRRPPLTTTAIAAKTDPGLVDVISTLGYEHGTAEGTGMVLTSNGEILTNNHVVAGATSIKVSDIGNGRTYTAKVVGYSDSNDVAVLKLANASGLATITTGDSSAVAVGQR